MALTAFLFVLWLVCSAFAYAITLAFFEYEHGDVSYGKERQNQGFAMLISLLFGPAALLVSYCLSGFAQHGLRWNAPTRAEARERHKYAFPYIHADYVLRIEGNRNGQKQG